MFAHGKGDMGALVDSNVSAPTSLQEKVRALGPTVLRFGLVVVIVWFAFMKFTDFGAHGIQPMVAKSPADGVDV